MVVIAKKFRETALLKGREELKTSGSQTQRKKKISAQEVVDHKKAVVSLAFIMESLIDDQAENIISIDITGKTLIADCMVLSSGRSTRHVSAIADHLTRRLKQACCCPVQVEGMVQGDWVLVDVHDIIVHIFRPEVRQLYNLEKLWGADISADQITA